jgi:putative membrane protein
VAAVSEERRPDTQAELANERTYLAWLRTGLALVAVGVAAERVLPAEGIIWARQLIGGIAHSRRGPDGGSGAAALAEGRPCPACRTSHPPADLGYVVAAAIVLNGLATIVLLLRADAG